MSARDDFGSGAKSPGGWGGQGNARTAAGGGGHGSLGGGKGSNASGMGGLRGVGGGVGGMSIPPGMRDLFRGSPARQGGLLGDEYVQITDIPGVMKKNQVPTSYYPPGASWPPPAQSVGMSNWPAASIGRIPPDYTYPGFEGTDPNGIGRYQNMQVVRSYGNPGVQGGGGVTAINPARRSGGQFGSYNSAYNQTATKTGAVTKDQSRVPSSQYKGFNNPW